MFLFFLHCLSEELEVDSERGDDLPVEEDFGAELEAEGEELSSGLDLDDGDGVAEEEEEGEGSLSGCESLESGRDPVIETKVPASCSSFPVMGAPSQFICGNLELTKISFCAPS